MEESLEEYVEESLLNEVAPRSCFFKTRITSATGTPRACWRRCLWIPRNCTGAITTNLNANCMQRQQFSDKVIEEAQLMLSSYKLTWTEGMAERWINTRIDRDTDVVMWVCTAKNENIQKDRFS